MAVDAHEYHYTSWFCHHTVGNYTLETSNMLGICVVDPLRPYDSLTPAIAVAVPASSSPPSWLWVAIFVPVGMLLVAVFACITTYCVIVRKRAAENAEAHGGSKVGAAMAL